MSITIVIFFCHNQHLQLVFFLNIFSTKKCSLGSKISATSSSVQFWKHSVLKCSYIINHWSVSTVTVSGRLVKMMSRIRNHLLNSFHGSPAIYSEMPNYGPKFWDSRRVWLAEVTLEFIFCSCHEYPI